MDEFEYWKAKADKVAAEMGKQMQVIRDRYGVLSVYHISVKPGPLSETVYVTGEGNEDERACKA